MVGYSRPLHARTSFHSLSPHFVRCRPSFAFRRLPILHPTFRNSTTPQVQVWLQQEFTAHPPLPGQQAPEWLRWRVHVAQGMSELAALQAVHHNGLGNYSNVPAPAPVPTEAPVYQPPAAAPIQQVQPSHIAPGLYSKCHGPARSVQTNRPHRSMRKAGKSMNMAYYLLRAHYQRSSHRLASAEADASGREVDTSCLGYCSGIEEAVCLACGGVDACPMRAVLHHGGGTLQASSLSSSSALSLASHATVHLSSLASAHRHPKSGDGACHFSAPFCAHHTLRAGRGMHKFSPNFARLSCHLIPPSYMIPLLLPCLPHADIIRQHGRSKRIPPACGTD